MKDAEIETLLKKASDEYYNTGNSLLTDAEFDEIKEVLMARCPTSKFLQQVGAPVTRNKRQLPYGMYSLNKIKGGIDVAALARWKQTFAAPYCVSDKLDGTSCLIYYTRQNQDDDWKVELMTRGNGIIGGDITHLAKYIVPAGARNPKNNGQWGTSAKSMAVRAELIISKQNFQKYGGSMTSARALTNALVNRKSIDNRVIGAIDLVAYEVIDPPLAKSRQMTLLKQLGLTVVYHEMLKDFDDDFLSVKLAERRAESPYDIDGLVVESEGPFDSQRKRNPEHAFAYKKSARDTGSIVRVLAVEWRASKDGLLKPRVEYDPIHIDGIVMRYATAYNASFIVKNMIGPGAVIEMIRSNEVIPKIVRVVTPAEVPSMPTVPYTWNKTKVDVIVDGLEENVEVRIRRLITFFSEMGVENIGRGLVEKLWNFGFSSLNSYLEADADDFLRADGVGEVLAKKLYENIQKSIVSKDLPTVMKASNVFKGGIGSKKISHILETVPDVLREDMPDQRRIQLLLDVPGIQQKTAQSFADGLPIFREFMRQHPRIKIVRSVGEPRRGNLEGMVVVFSGFRDKQLEEKIVSHGGAVSSSVSSKTDLIIVKDTSSLSGKVQAAKSRGIAILALDNVGSLFER